jgi:hypothetical protein
MITLRIRRADKLFRWGLFPLLFLVVFCQNNAFISDNALIGNAHCEPFEYNILPFDNLPNARIDIEGSNTYREPLDSDSIELWQYRGGEYYHPTYLSRRCQEFIATYYYAKNEKYLQRAEHYAQKIMSECVYHDSVPYTVCHFLYAPHADSESTFTPPWPSGMSQGELMMVVMRLYELTGKQEYIDFGHKLFRGYTRLKRNHDWWIARIDTANYYWIEEYPHSDKPGCTLNGFIYALYGIYDYFRITDSPDARRVLDMSLTTIKHYMPDFRQEGSASYYCLGHKMQANEAYHVLHLQMMIILYNLTGDSFFLTMSNYLKSDRTAAYKSQP